MSCAAPVVVVGGETLSTSDFENSQELLNTVSGDGGDPTLDGYDENIANGNNSNNRAGVQFPPSTQTSLPTPSPIPANQTDDKKPSQSNGTDPTCPVFAVVDNATYDIQLSPNFKVRNFTINAVFRNQILPIIGLTPQDRVCNLKGVATNICEPMLARFGPFNINSGLRNQNTTPNGISQHVKGEAVDIQFPGWTYARYWENATWIRDNIAYDQFIFEHSDKTGLAWYHLSFNRAGNRAASLPTKVMTMYRNHYDSGLKRYG